MRESFADTFRGGTEAVLSPEVVAGPPRRKNGRMSDHASRQAPDKACFDKGCFDKAHTDEASVEHFTHLVLNSPDSNAVDFVDQLFRDGATANVIFTDILTPSAKLLGTMWQRDECSFVDVTLGLSTIHRILYREADRLDQEIDAKSHDHAILITPLPGEDHIFAASLLAEYFRAARWTVRSGVGESTDTIVQIVRRQFFDVVGVTVSSVQKIPDCRQLIGDIREHSLNRNVKILTGGPPFLESEVTCDDVNSDATATDAIDAVRVATIVCEDLTQFRC